MHREKRDVVSVDGKTIRGSKSSEHKAYYVVSAFLDFIAGEPLKKTASSKR